MRKAALVGVAIVLMAGFVSADELYSERFDRSFALQPGGRVSLDNVNGDVHIGVWDSNEVKVEAVKEASDPDLLNALQIEVDARADAVLVSTHYPNQRETIGDRLFSDRHRHMRVEYTITVPRSASIDRVELVNGALDVEGVEGGLRVRVVNGEIRAAAVGGTVQVKTVNGAINLSYDRLAPGDSLELESVNGSIELALPDSAGATVRSESVNGHLSNDFGIAVNRHRHSGADMNGDIAGGGARVELSTVNGSIRLVRR